MLKKNILRNVSNIPGWRSKRKIVVIESDDWGSIRTRDKEARDILVQSGASLKNSIFFRYDCLENNHDLSKLFDLLMGFKDISGRNPVITPYCLMANPDFEKIRNNDFKEYFYEDCVETYKRYPNSDKVVNLYKQGIDNKLFMPALHGREHINIESWMDALTKRVEGIFLPFEYETIGIAFFKGENVPQHLAAFHPEKKTEILTYHKIIKDAGELFFNRFGFLPKTFIAPAKEDAKETELTLKQIGVEYICRSQNRMIPLGDGKFVREFNWLGKRNKLGQIYLTRNCFFEPTYTAFNGVNFLENCLNEIEIAFRWNKPAIISTHRLNYVGGIDEVQRDDSLKALGILLKSIQKKWPDIEFMSSTELGDLISEG